MSEPPSSDEAQAFDDAVRAILEGFDRTRQLRGRFLDGMIELEVELDDVLCDFMRIDPSLHEIVRRTVLAAPLRSKINSLDSFLTTSGIDRRIIKRLFSLADLRDMFAHAQVSRPRGGKLADKEPLIFTSYRNGKVRQQTYTERDLAERLKDLGAAWFDIHALKDVLFELRKGTTYLHVVTSSGAQFWNTRQAKSDDVS